ncbi:MAG: hypothetical protein ACM3P0_00830 [Acidobacteriota bacterium]
MKTRALKILLALSTFLFLIPGCSKDEATQPKEDPLIAGDYFPTERDVVWGYSSNAVNDSGKSFMEFEMVIDTFSYRRGVFKAMIGRFGNDPRWGSIVAIKDSAGIIYSLGDNPPGNPYPLFKHQYKESEVTRETITVNGIVYETLRRSITDGPDTLTLWFSDKFGLVKEFSRQGMSLFSDNNRGKHIAVTTELKYCFKFYRAPIRPYPPMILE